MNKYKLLLPVRLGYPGHDKDYEQGDEFEVELSPEDERANVESGLLEIVPQRYKVVGGSVVYDTKPGDEFEAALYLENEAILVQGGHIERVKPAPKKKEK